MKIAILITARLGSTRLQRKHLLRVAGRPILQYLIDAVREEFREELGSNRAVLAIATSEKPENVDFQSEITDAEVFFGSDENIPLRHLQAARHFGCQAILSVDGDDILISRAAMRAVFEALSRGAGRAMSTGLPLGLNAGGYSTGLLSDRLQAAGEGVFETGWTRIFDGIATQTVDFGFREDPRLRFTLDYDVDFEFFSAVLTHPAYQQAAGSDEKLIKFVEDSKLYEITLPVVDVYWENFNNRKSWETTGKPC